MVTSSTTGVPESQTFLQNPSCLEDAAFHTGLAHFYRAEMHRMTVWRTRLDTTSHWAILLTTGMITFTLGSQTIPHYILLLGLALIGICLVMEARRYRHLHHSKWRLQLMERGYFAESLSPGLASGSVDWRRLLALDLARPHYTISWALSMRLRLRRNYLMLVYFITAVWLTKIFIHPESVGSAGEFFVRMCVGGLFPSWFVAATAGVFVLASTALVAVTPSEEALEHWTYAKHFERLDVGMEPSGTGGAPSEEGAAPPAA